MNLRTYFTISYNIFGYHKLIITGIDYFSNYQNLKTSIEKKYDLKIVNARNRVKEIESAQNKELANRQDIKDLKEDRKYPIY